MRSFEELSQIGPVSALTQNENSTLYFWRPPAGVSMVRHFGSQVSPKLVHAWVTLHQAAAQWIEDTPGMNQILTLGVPTEEGSDFVVRPHQIYQVDTRSYVEGDNPTEIPEGLASIRSMFTTFCGDVDDPRVQLVEQVLGLSVLEPTGKAWLDEERVILHLVELKPSPQELERWAHLQGS